MTFSDRAEAGRLLARRLLHLRGPDVVVLGLARGGMPVASEVAAGLDAPLDVLVVRKLGVPFQPELAMGAVGEDGALMVDPRVVRAVGLSREELAAIVDRERAEVDRRVSRLRAGRDRLSVSGRVVVVVDDGIATGSTAIVGCKIVGAAGARRVVLAAPVAPKSLGRRLAGAADEVVCLVAAERFRAVGDFYRDFSQVTDQQVTAILRRRAPDAASGERRPGRSDSD